MRDHYGVPVLISSCYRCLTLNRAIRSGDTSQHIKGEAVDFEVAGKSNLAVARWIRDTLKFDQLLLEFYKGGEPYSGWVHCSFKKDKNRKEVLTISNKGTFRGLVG